MFGDGFQFSVVLTIMCYGVLRVFSLNNSWLFGDESNHPVASLCQKDFGCSLGLLVGCFDPWT